MTTHLLKARFHAFYALLFIFTTAPVAAQNFSSKANFRVETNADTVAKGQAFEVRYIVENAEASRFSLPNFEHFQTLSGPMTSSNISIINGQRSQKIIYTYWLSAPQLGQFELPAIEIPTSTGYLRCPAKKLVVNEKGSQNLAPKNAPANPFNQPLADPFAPNIDINQFFNNPNIFNFEMPSFNLPQIPDFNNLFKDFEQLFDQQYKDKLPQKPAIDPKTNQPIYKI
jgi:hypothetical protein